MSYYANVVGAFVVPVENLIPLRDFLVRGKETEPRIPKSLKERDAVAEEIRVFLKESGYFFSVYKNECFIKNQCIEFCLNGDFNYDEDEFFSVMKKIPRFCAPKHEIEFCFAGEDAENWKFVWDSKEECFRNLSGQVVYDVPTALGQLSVRAYDDGCAKGIQIILDGNIVSAVDVLNEKDGVPGEARALVYSKKDIDEPTSCIHLEV